MIAMFMPKCRVPVDVVIIGEGQAVILNDADGYTQKTYCVGINGEHYAGSPGDELPKFLPNVAMVDMMRETPLHSLHLELGAKDGSLCRV